MRLTTMVRIFHKPIKFDIGFYACANKHEDQMKSVDIKKCAILNIQDIKKWNMTVFCLFCHIYKWGRTKVY